MSSVFVFLRKNYKITQLYYFCPNSYIGSIFNKNYYLYGLIGCVSGRLAMAGKTVIAGL